MAFIEGSARGQEMLLPAKLEDYVASGAFVRLIDAFVVRLDMAGLAFKRAVPLRSGRPPYDPRDMLKLYIYGYINGVRSSRRLECECARNVELMWLVRELAPDFKTIADFRRDNGPGIVGCCAEFVRFCRAQNLFAGTIAAIDGSKVQAVASPRRVLRRAELQKEIARLDEEITAHLAAMDQADAAEPDAASGQAVVAALSVLQANRAVAAAIDEQISQTGGSHLVQGEPEARRMGKSGEAGPPCYNVQIAVDPKSHIIIHHAVVTDANDLRQLHPMAEAARAVLGCDTLTAVADTGYCNATHVARCEASNIIAAAPAGHHVNTHGDFFPATAFAYHAETDTMTCPAGKTLVRNGWRSDKSAVRYRAKDCAACPLKPNCTSGQRRHVYRLDDQPALDRMAQRMAADPGLMIMRRCTAEHPFASLKHILGRRFSLRGKAKAATETALAVLAYNITRANNLLGTANILAKLA